MRLQRLQRSPRRRLRRSPLTRISQLTLRPARLV